MYVRTSDGLGQVTPLWGWPSLGTPPSPIPRVLTYSTRDVIDKRISVPAQHSLVRLSKNPATSADAVGMLEAVKIGRLSGIYCVNWEKPAKRALGLGKSWWTVIPQSEDAVLMLDPDNPSGGQPLIAFRRELDPRKDGCGSLKTDKTLTPSPAKLDAALLKAWASYRLWQTGQLAPCSGGTPGVITALAAFERPPLLRVPVPNVVPPGYCQGSQKIPSEIIPTGYPGPNVPAPCPLASDPDDLQPAGILTITSKPNEHSYLLYGFAVLSEQLDLIHVEHLKKIVKQHQLNGNTRWRVTRIRGHSDCREDALGHIGFRDARAREVESALIHAGARSAYVAKGDTGSIQSSKLRVQRSVLLVVRKKGTPPQQGGGNPAKDVASKKWALRTMGSVEVAAGYGGTQIAFELWNRTSGKVYSCLFTSTTGVGLTLGITVSPGGWERFRTFQAVKPDRFIDHGARVESAGVSIGPLGYQYAKLQLTSVKMDPSPIDIGGFSAGIGLKAGTVIAIGTFSVHPRGQLPGMPTA